MPGWVAIQSRSKLSKPGTSNWASSSQKVESDGDFPKSVPNRSLSVRQWHLANRYITTHEPWLRRIERIATSIIHHWGMRKPRHIRQSSSA
jgi:hypothetical protein